MESYDNSTGGRFSLASLQSPLAIGAIAFVAGLLIGLIVLGWYVFPVQWTDATPEHLRADYQEAYLRMAIDAHTLRPDEALAHSRYEALGEAGPEILAAIAASPGQQNPEAIALFQTLVGAASPGGSGGGLGVTPGAQTPPTEEPPDEGGINIRTILIFLCGGTLLVVAAVVVFYLLRNRTSSAMGGRGMPSASRKAQEFTRSAEQTDYESLGESQPMSQWMTTYVIGDDLFDDSFSIDSAAGEFMGECGVGIADTIGVGDPKKVTAFEVWLFDKNDIQTVTKVLMSTHAFNDAGIRDRLEAKGEPILANPGQEVVLETETLQMVARVVDMIYGDGALPRESFFDRMTIELAVWSKI